MFYQIGVDINFVKTYEEHKESETQYEALMQRHLGQADPDNNESDLIIIRKGLLEFTQVGFVFYGMLFECRAE